MVPQDILNFSYVASKTFPNQKMKMQNKHYLGTDNLVETWYPYISNIINIIISKKLNSAHYKLR